MPKCVEALDEPDLHPGDRRNLGFKGTTVTRGRAVGLVVETGMRTEIGRIAGLLAADDGVLTPLQQRLARFGRHLSLAVLAICAVVFASGLLQGQPPVLMFLTAVSLAVAAIPEALPAVITVSLALGARKLGRPQQPGAASPGRGDARLRDLHLLGQDRNAHREPHAPGGDRHGG